MAISLPTLVQKLRVDTSELNTAQGAVGNFASRVGGQLRSVGRTATVSLTVPIVGFGISAVKATADVEKRLRETNSLFGVTGAAADRNFGDLTKLVRDLSDELGVAQSTIADGLYEAISSGIPKENAFEFMRVATAAATAGVTDTQTAVDGLTTYINAFGLQASDAEAIADSMFATINGGKTTMEELSSSVAQLAAPAAAAGVEFQEMNAMIAAMTAAGVPTAQTTVWLASAIRGLSRPSEELNKAFQAAGYASGELMIQEEGLAAAMQVVKDASGGSSAELNKLVGSSQAANAINLLLGESSALFQKELERQADSAGSASAAFDELEKSSSRQFERLTTDLQNASMDLATELLPILQDVVAWVTRGVEWFSNLSDESKRLVLIGAGIAAALGPVLFVLGSLITIGSKVITAVLGLGKAFGVVMKGLNMLRTALMANPWMLLIAALIAVVVLVVKNWDTIKEAVLSAVRWIRDTVNRYWEALRAITSAVWKRITDWLRSTWNRIVRNVTVILLKVQITVRRYFEAARSVVRNVMDAIRSGISSAWNAIKRIFDTVISAIRRVISWYFNAIKWYFTGWWREVTSLFTSETGFVERIIQNAGAAVGRLWRAAMDKVKEIASNAWDAVKRTFTGAVNAVKRTLRSGRTALGNIWNGLKGVMAKPINWVIDNVINKFLSGVKSIASALSFNLNVPTIPRVPEYHQGGIVGRGRPREHRGRLKNNEVLAVLEEGEKVIPASEVRGRHDLSAPDETDVFQRLPETGGPLDFVGRAFKSATEWIGDKVRDALAGLANPVIDAAVSLMDRTVGRWGLPGQMIAGVVRALAAKIKEWVGGVEKEVEENVGGGIGPPPPGGAPGWQWMWSVVKAALPFARLTSAFRPGAITATGNRSYHGMGRAVDLAGRTPMHHGDMLTIANWIARNYGARTRELIYSGPGAPQIHNGRPHFYTGITRQNHFDHVHWAMATGGRVRRPGRYLIGENGPEVLNLGQGARVAPLPDLVEAAERAAATVVGTRAAGSLDLERQLAGLREDLREFAGDSIEQTVYYARPGQVTQETELALRRKRRRARLQGRR